MNTWHEMIVDVGVSSGVNWSSILLCLLEPEDNTIERSCIEILLSIWFNSILPSWPKEKKKEESGGIG